MAIASAVPGVTTATGIGVKRPKRPQQPGLQLQGGDGQASAGQGLNTTGNGTPQTGSGGGLVQPPSTPRDTSPGGAAPPAPPTFQQMQQNGQARPAPPVAPPAPVQNAGVQSALQSAVTKQLQTPSRYDTATFNAIRDPAVADLESQYAKIRDTTNTNLASRGLASSTFGANDFHDVDSAQSRDLANLNASLLKGAADTQGADTSQAINSGLNYGNSELASQLGLGNLGVSQQNANTNAQSTANQMALGTGSLTGSFNGSPTAESQQFKDSLSQALGIATMGDKTQNRQVDANSALAQNDLMLRVAQFLGISSPKTTTPQNPYGTSTNTPVTPPSNPGGGYTDQPTPGTDGGASSADVSRGSYSPFQGQVSGALGGSPAQGANTIDAWYAQHGSGPRMSQDNRTGGTTIDAAAQAIMSMPQELRAEYGITPEIYAQAQQAAQEANDRFAYGQTHGGFDTPTNDPNARRRYRQAGPGAPITGG